MWREEQARFFTACAPHESAVTLCRIRLLKPVSFDHCRITAYIENTGIHGTALVAMCLP